MYKIFLHVPSYLHTKVSKRLAELLRLNAPNGGDLIVQ